jgi:hypothetical protein
MIPHGEVVWVFNGNRNRFPSAIFASQAQAERWIAEQRVTGTLTVYPVHVSAYEWAVSAGVFVPRTPAHESPDYVANFSSASQHHFYFEHGQPSQVPGTHRRRRGPRRVRAIVRREANGGDEQLAPVIAAIGPR